MFLLFPAQTKCKTLRNQSTTRAVGAFDLRDADITETTLYF